MVLPLLPLLAFSTSLLVASPAYATAPIVPSHYLLYLKLAKELVHAGYGVTQLLQQLLSPSYL